MKIRIFLSGVAAGTLMFASGMAANSFENSADLQGIAGRVERSRECYLFGEHALKWSAEPGASLRIPMPLKNNGKRAFGFYLRNVERMPDAGMTLSVGDSRRKCEYRVEIPLDFSGWQMLRAHGAEDFAATPAAGAGDELVLTYRGAKPAVFYLDGLLFQQSWARLPNLRLPMINRGRTPTYTTIPGRDYAAAIAAQRARWANAPEPTAGERAALQLLRERCRNFLTVTSELAAPELTAAARQALREAAPEAWRSYQALELADGADGLMTFRPHPLFTDRPDAYFRGFRNFSGKLMLPLFQAAFQPFPGNADYGRPEYKTAMVQLMKLLLYRGHTDGGDHDMIFVFAVRGLGQGCLLLREELQQAGVLDAMAASVLWHSYALSNAIDDGRRLEVSADTLRVCFAEATFAALALDDRRANAVLKSIRHILEEQTQFSGGNQGLIKRDGSLFHHWQTAHKSYGPDGLHGALSLAYLLRNTPYRLSAKALDRMRLAIVALDRQQSCFDTPAATNVRWCFASGNARTLAPICAYYLALRPDDREIAGIFRRVYQPAALAGDFTHGSSLRNTPGEFSLLGEQFDRLRQLPPSPPPQGCFAYNSATQLIHRRGNWMAAIRGFGPHSWDVEIGIRGAGGIYENKLARFVSHGALQIFAPGKNGVDGGYVNSGWDFRHFPGTTALELSPAELELPKSAGYGRKYGRGRLVGGCTLNDWQGVYGFELRDPHLRDFTAFKSYHLVNNTIVALGSGIANSQSGSETVTTLFQNYLGAAPVGESGHNSRLLEQPEVLTDVNGTRYFIPAGMTLETQRIMQQGSDECGRPQPLAGFFETALLRHGRAPRDGRYEYAVSVDAPTLRPDYRVLQQDAAAHVVYFPGEKLYSAAVAGKNAPLAAELPVKMVSTPLLLLARELPDGTLELAVTDPDYKWGEVHPSKINRHTFPKPGVVRLTLRNAWTVKEGRGKLRDGVLEIKATPGEIHRVVLRKP